jgi:hypothetical protein
LLLRVPENPVVFGALASHTGPDHRATIDVRRDWRRDAASGEWRFECGNSLLSGDRTERWDGRQFKEY